MVLSQNLRTGEGTAVEFPIMPGTPPKSMGFEMKEIDLSLVSCVVKLFYLPKTWVTFYFL